MLTWRREYQAARIAALTACASGESWPEWDDGMQFIDDQWVVEGDYEVQCRLPLPADIQIRHWLALNVYSGDRGHPRKAYILVTAISCSGGHDGSTFGIS